jgi:hypothetical protein
MKAGIGAVAHGPTSIDGASVLKVLLPKQRTPGRRRNVRLCVASLGFRLPSSAPIADRG